MRRCAARAGLLAADFQTPVARERQRTVGKQRNKAPLLDQFSISFADLPYISIKIEKTYGVYATVVFPQGSVPIYLICETVPGHTADR